MTTCPSCGADNPAGNAFCEKCGKSVVAPSRGPALQTMSDLQTIGGEPTQRRSTGGEIATLVPGTVFADRYTIESLIGNGGMGVVYRAKDRIGNRDVALKLIRSDRLGGQGAVEKLIAEGVLTQDIRHKNVVAVYHVDQIAGQPFMAMEFVNGASLREWHRKIVNARKDVPVAVAARIIAEVLNGLEVAHDMGIVHRDLKPENIMLTAEPTEAAAPLKLLDFGIARVAGSATDSGSTGLGTPRYMAPEQITNPDSATPAADFYSLSTIFYELLVDVLPQGGWQPPSSGRPDVPQGVDALIQAGLQNRPASRPQSVADYRQRLNAAFGGGGGQVRPVVNHLIGGDTIPRAPSAGVPMWAKVGGGAFAGLLLLGGLAAALGGDDPPPPPPPNNYAQMAGQWVDDSGGTLNVNIASNGTFTGGGQSGGYPMSIQGSFSGADATYTLSNGGSGQLHFDGGCHLDYRTTTPQGPSQGRFHINHQPNQPCPGQ